MSLDLTLSLPKPRIKFQEEALLKATLRNGSRASAIRIPVFSPGSPWPRFRVRSEATGEESVFTSREPQFKPSEKFDFLPARTEFDLSFQLRDRIRFPAPGRYTIVAECPWKDGQEMAKSPPLAVEIEPMAFLRAGASMTQEARTGMFLVFWTDGADPRAHKGREPVFRSLVLNDRAPEAAGVADLDLSIPAAADFRIATLPNRAAGKSVWLTWREGRDIVSRPVGYDSWAAREIATKLPDVRVSLLSNPLSPDIFNLEIPLWLGDKDGETGKIQMAQLNAGGQSRPAGDAMLSSALHPVWSQTVFLSTGERRLYVLLSERGKLKLNVLSWRHPMELEPLKELAQFEGEWIGGGASVHLNDDVGAILLVRGKADRNVARAISWIHYPSGEFEIAPPHPIALEGADSVDRVLVKINERNEPFVAAKPLGRRWMLSAAGEDFAPIAAPPGEAKGFFEMILGATGEPIFVYANPGLGLAFANAEGSRPAAVSA